VALDVCVGSTTVNVVFPAAAAAQRAFVILDSWLDSQEKMEQCRNYKTAVTKASDGARAPRHGRSLISCLPSSV